MKSTRILNINRMSTTKTTRKNEETRNNNSNLNELILVVARCELNLIECFDISSLKNKRQKSLERDAMPNKATNNETESLNVKNYKIIVNNLLGCDKQPKSRFFLSILDSELLEPTDRESEHRRQQQQ